MDQGCCLGLMWEYKASSQIPLTWFFVSVPFPSFFLALFRSRDSFPSGFCIFRLLFAIFHSQPSTGPQHSAIPLTDSRLNTQFAITRPCLPCRQVSLHILDTHVRSVLVELCQRLSSSAFHLICLVAFTMAGTQPQAQATPPPPNRWQCHVCHGGPHLYAITTRCTSIRSNNLPCNHDFCHDHCKKDNDIPPPLTTTQSSLPGLHATPKRSHSMLPTTLFGDSTNFARHSRMGRPDSSSTHPPAGKVSRKHHDSETFHTRRSAPRNNDAQCRSRPSMAGWWRCGFCSQMNNPALHTGRCWSCGHPGPCRCCTKY